MSGQSRKTLTRIAFCLVWIALASPVQPIASAQGHEARMNVENSGLEAHFPVGSSVVEVPFRLEANKILVDVKVNGSKPLPFVLDTGAPTSVLLKPDTVAAESLEIIGQAHVGGAGGEGDFQIAQLAGGVRLEVGDLRIEDARMVIMPDQGEKHIGTSPWAGIFGAQLFASAAVEIDWVGERLRLYEPSTFEASPEAVAVPLEIHGGHVYAAAEVTVDGRSKQVALVVDTGASHALALDPAKVAAPARRLRNAVLGRGLNGVLTGDISRVDRLRIGGLSFDNVVTSFPDTAPTVLTVGADGNLGTEVLRRSVVTFDYERNRMLLEPGEAAAEPFVFSTSGLRIEPWLSDDGSVGVDEVYADSPAARAGLSTGDRVVAVNSQPISELGIDATKDLLQQPPGTRVALQVRRASELREVELVLKPIL